MLNTTIENIRKEFDEYCKKEKIVIGHLSGDKDSPVFVNNELNLPRFKSFFDHSLLTLIEEIEREVEDYPRKIFELYEGKLPFVIFKGKADEAEKMTIYTQAFKDVLSLLSQAFKGVL